MAADNKARKEKIMKEDMLLSISSDAFIDVRGSFDRILETVLKKMEIRDSDKAAITLDIGITLENVKTTDTATGEVLNVKNPEIKYSIKHKLDYKAGETETGSIRKADSYLVCENGQWKIRPIEDG